MNKFRILALIVLLLDFNFLFSKTTYTPLETNPLFDSWRWKSFPELSNKNVRCFVEGKDKSMWFGTGKGVFHYDGIKWNTYFNENPVLQSPIFGLFYTSSGILYVVSNTGICHFSNDLWKTDLLLSQDVILGSQREFMDVREIMNVIETRNGDILIGVNLGVLKINKSGIVCYTTKLQIKNIGDLPNDLKIIDITGVYEGIDALHVFNILEDQSENLWIGLQDGRIICLFDKKHDIKTPGRYKVFNTEDGLNVSPLPVLFQTKSGTLYSISQTVTGALNQFNFQTEKWTFHTLSTEFGGDNIYFSICESSDGCLWIGGLSRMFTFKNNIWSQYKQPDLQVPQTRVIIKETSDGSIWIAGHLSDVLRIQYNTPIWETFKGLNYQCDSKDGNQWFLSGDGKVVVYDPGIKLFNKLDDEFPLTEPVRMFCDSSGVLWALGSYEGVAALAYNVTGSWSIKTFPDLCWGFHPNGVFQAKDKSIWFGSNADCDKATWGIVQYLPSLGYPSLDNAWKYYPGTQICEVAYGFGEAENNSLICGYFKGLFEYNGSNTRSLDKKLVNDIIKVESIVQDLVKGIWIGSRSQGVIYYNSDKDWKQYTVEDGLASNSVSSVLMALDSTLWVATDKGISRFDGKKWVKYALPESFKFGRSNGYLTQGKDGSIWVCNTTVEWSRRAHYKQMYTDENSPLISYRINPEKSSPVSEITQYDKKVYYPGNTMIFWSGADAWNETEPGDLQFSYKLDNKNWSDFSQERSHNFSSLKRGWHSLKLRARDKFLNVETMPAEVKFKVIPPIWGQIWFLILMAILVGSLVYLFSATIKKNREVEAQNLSMKRKNSDLENQQKEIEEKGKQIMELLEKEKENNWFNEGLILINEVIKTNNDNIDQLAHKIVNALVDYLKINASGLFLYRSKEEDADGNGYLELVASYGVNKEQLGMKKIILGEGLPGACFIDKKTMISSNVPESYYLSSGLGKSTLTSLILVPLKLQDETIGVLELASLKMIDEKTIRLIETLSENIASNIITLEARKKIDIMFHKSQEQAVLLHEQDEELRQQMEELQATQEESNRRELSLLNTIEDFKKKEKNLKEEIRKLKVGKNE
jgi:ligand-binding sensor domain-containing protein/putative methionine-R-sulfoxide reductase with GAF domain